MTTARNAAGKTASVEKFSSITGYALYSETSGHATAKFSGPVNPDDSLISVKLAVRSWLRNYRNAPSELKPARVDIVADGDTWTVESEGFTTLSSIPL
jgi:endonuclease YncB( thermonuclease family)